MVINSAQYKIISGSPTVHVQCANTKA